MGGGTPGCTAASEPKNSGIGRRRVREMPEATGEKENLPARYPEAGCPPGLPHCRYLSHICVAPPHPLAHPGALWYQGEIQMKNEPSNTTCRVLHDDPPWRKRWGKVTPFAIVQLPTFAARPCYQRTKPGTYPRCAKKNGYANGEYRAHRHHRHRRSGRHSPNKQTGCRQTTVLLGVS